VPHSLAWKTILINSH